MTGSQTAGIRSGTADEDGTGCENLGYINTPNLLYQPGTMINLCVGNRNIGIRTDVPPT